MHAIDHLLDLPRYADWSPTGFDARGLGCPDRQDWRVLPVSRNRDNESDPLTASNWEASIRDLERVDPEGIGHETASFGHWACGWFEIILIDPDGPAAECAGEITCALDAYPVLDEARFSELESDAQIAYWADLSLSERMEILSAEGLCYLRARFDDFTEAGLRAECNGSGGVSFYADRW